MVIISLTENRGMNVKKFIYTLGFILLVISGQSFSAPEKIAVVDVISILQNMPERQQVAKALDQEFKSRSEKLRAEEKKTSDAAQRLQKENMTLPAAEKQKLTTMISAFEEKARAFSQDYRKRESEEANKLLTKIQKAVSVIVKKEDYAIVLKAEAAFYANNVSDITDKVLEQVKK